MTLDQLRSFVAVAKHQNFSKASVELHLTQPSVSNHLKTLEAEINTKLYQRLGRGIELTDLGRLLLRQVRPILDQIAKLQNVFPTSAQRVEQNLLKVASSHSPAVELLPSLFARLRKKHPQLEIELTIRAAENLERGILSSQAEIAVSSHPSRLPELACEPLRKRKLVLFVSRHHPLAKKSRVSLSDVGATPLIIRTRRGSFGTTETLLKELKDRGQEFNVQMRCEEPYAIKAAVRNNLGIGVLFEDTVKPEITSGYFKVLEGHGLRLKGSLFIIYPQGKPLSPVAKELLQLLRRMRSKEFRGAPSGAAG